MIEQSAAELTMHNSYEHVCLKKRFQKKKTSTAAFVSYIPDKSHKNKIFFFFLSLLIIVILNTLEATSSRLHNVP